MSSSQDSFGTVPSTAATLDDSVAGNSSIRNQQELPETEMNPITGKRRIVGLAQKGSSETAASNAMDASILPTTLHAPLSKRPAELKPSHISSARHPYPSAAASPSHLRSPSPRPHSPASSEIFERSVQEPVPISTLQGELSPAHIPTHVMTEDHIPAALEASAQAITSHNLNADEVEIVMSAAHQPAGASVLDGTHADGSQPYHGQHRGSDPADLTSMQQSGLLPISAGEEEGPTSSYGQLDPNDVRRLSFISFADVVQSEHNHQMASAMGETSARDPVHHSNLPNIASASDPAASPLRSPRSPASTTSGTGVSAAPSVPMALNPTISNPEQSPARSTNVHSPSQHGDLTIETMRQAVRKTASGDLGAAGRNP